MCVVVGIFLVKLDFGLVVPDVMWEVGYGRWEEVTLCVVVNIYFH